MEVVLEILYVACQGKKLFKIDLSKFEIVELQKMCIRKCLTVLDYMMIC